MLMAWKPNVTVAAIAERDGKFLLVEELTEFGARFNQPAGHLEANESITEGVIRETLEETAYGFIPGALVGIYYWHYPNKNLTYLRFAFSGTITSHDPERKLDKGIIHANWYSVDAIRRTVNRHRSPLVMQCVDDYLQGKRYPLELLTHYD
jgi:NADH pyrophosphatase NudC (nudix superfamily)